MEESWHWILLVGCAALIVALVASTAIGYSRTGNAVTANNVDTFLEETSDTKQQELKHYDDACITGTGLAQFVQKFPDVKVTVKTLYNPTGFDYKDRKGMGKTAFQLTEQEKQCFVEESAVFSCMLTADSNGFYTEACFEQIKK